jgi:GST-like protein
MIEVYTHGGPSPRKVTIMLEECELPYRWEWVNAYANEHKSSAFLAKNPNGRIPAIVDPEGPDGPITLWESAAIVLYLAEKTGRFLPSSGTQRYNVLKWASFQATHAPYLGSVHWYRFAAPAPDRHSIDKYTIEAARIYALIDTQLSHHRYIAGDDFSIADISFFPWVEYHEWQGQTLSDTPNLQRWYKEMLERPGVARGRCIPYPAEEYGESAESKAANALIVRRLADPAYATPPNPAAAIFQATSVAPLEPNARALADQRNT